MNPPSIKNLRTDEHRLVFELDQDREVSLPISVSPRLASATATQRAHWTLGPHGMFGHWPDVDEDIAIWEVLGITEDVYLRSLREAPSRVTGTP